ncbi:MAG TPA: hypothetical protein VK603_22075, partial [Candidatus Saccharimonadales bacterium]|nr:hypothetical protein [Candidatus Saccharimonadales bacterium]
MAVPLLLCTVYFVCVDDELVWILLSRGFGLGKFLIEPFDLLTILLIEPADRGALFLQRPFFLTQLGLQQCKLGLKFRAHLLAFLRDGRFVLVRRRLQVLKTLLEHIPL